MSIPGSNVFPGWGQGGPPARRGSSVVDRWSRLDLRRLAPARWFPARPRAGARLSLEESRRKEHQGQAPGPRVLWPLVATRWFLGPLPLIRSRGYFVRYAKTDLGRIFREKFYRFSDYLGTTSQMSELLGISSISGILRFGRYPAYHGISEPHLAVKSSKSVVENRPYY